MRNQVHFYGEIQKRDDAKRLVEGHASTEAVDSDGEIILRAGLEEALADYMQFANVREMHSASAVGVTKEAEIDHRGLYIVVKVVDDDAWKKVHEGVYRGFSIGGRVRERDAANRKVIKRLSLHEISLVDRPSNPDARFQLVKLAYSADEPDAVTLALDALEDLKTAFAAKFPKPEPLDPIASRDQQIALLEKRLSDAMNEPLPPKTGGPLAHSLIGTPGFQTPFEKAYGKGYEPQVRAVSKGTDAAGGASDAPSATVDPALVKN